MAHPVAGLREKDVKESGFLIELEFEVPEGFWDKDPEPPYYNPSQKYFWKRAMPPEPSEYDWRDGWLDNFHDALSRRKWPRQSIDASYSYFEEPLQNPDMGQERDPDRLPAMRFYLWLPGEWLVDHPEFFKDLEKLGKKGVMVRARGKKVPSRLFYYRIFAQNGPLQGADWEGTYFDIYPGRQKPEAFEGGPRDWFPEEPE